MYYNIVRELAKLWIFQNIAIANVQGTDMLSIALPESVALQFISQKFGKQVLNDYIKRKEDRYKKNRGNEPNVEPPLVYADGTDYLEENKGALAMYSLIEKLGDDLFYRTLNDWADAVDSRQENAVFRDISRTRNSWPGMSSNLMTGVKLIVRIF